MKKTFITLLFGVCLCILAFFGTIHSIKTDGYNSIKGGMLAFDLIEAAIFALGIALMALPPIKRKSKQKDDASGVATDSEVAYSQTYQVSQGGRKGGTMMNKEELANFDNLASNLENLDQLSDDERSFLFESFDDWDIWETAVEDCGYSNWIDFVSYLVDYYKIEVIEKKFKDYYKDGLDEYSIELAVALNINGGSAFMTQQIMEYIDEIDPGEEFDEYVSEARIYHSDCEVFRELIMEHEPNFVYCPKRKEDEEDDEEDDGVWWDGYPSEDAFWECNGI